MRLLAIDPGCTESAFVVIDTETREPIRFGKVDNAELRRDIRSAKFDDCRHFFIEMVASYGMAVGAEVFETCVWTGRFMEVIEPDATERVKRLSVKLHHCHDSKAKDANITQALVDRFAPGQPNHGKGTKAEPGFFHGFHRDIWQAFALAVYAADTLTER